MCVHQEIFEFHTTRPVPHHIDEKKVATSSPVPPLHQTSSVNNGISIEAPQQLHRSTAAAPLTTRSMAESYEREQSSTHLTSGTQIGSAPTPTPPSIDLEAPTGTESTREGQQREGQQGEEHQGEESHGTSTLNRHLNECPSNPNRIVDKKQKKLDIEKKPEEEDDGLVKLKVLEFNQEECRIALAKMIIMDELPFRFVENPGLRGLVYLLQPQFQIPSRMTVYRDCMQLFLFEKGKLKSILSNNSQMVSITTDTWTSIQNLNYMCVTGHYIDDSWVLNKKVLGFFLIADHRGETIGKALEKCLKDWGIAKICTVTVDNASANNVALSYLTRRLSDWNCITILNGQYMHLRCCAHILNLIVNDGLKEVDISIARIRAACKFVKSSPSRLANFKRCVCECNIESKLMVTLDVPTRWNSTYTMLDTAEKFEKAFDRLEFDDPNYLSVLNNEGGCPTSDDWKRARVFVKFLKVFYDATLVFSGSLHVTSNAFLMKLCDITKMLNFWIESNDVMLRNMAKNMKVKLEKYWDGGDNMKYMLFVAVILDPHHKMAYIELCFSKMYGLDKCRHMLVKLKELLVNLFEYYQVLYPLPPDSTDSSCLISDTSSFGGGGNDRDDKSWSSQFYSQIRRKQSSEKKNELDKYLEDEVEFNYDGFDILKWWKSKAMKYRVISRIARDVFSIPISTVSSESAFSTGGRVLDAFRSSLNPTTVEALVCAQNWLRISKKEIDLRSSMDEIERIEAESWLLQNRNHGSAAEPAEPLVLQQNLQTNHEPWFCWRTMAAMNGEVNDAEIGHWRRRRGDWPLEKTKRRRASIRASTLGQGVDSCFSVRARCQFVLQR
ncbi:zinc finger BED domain-containing protein RICESLEEPER 2-like [Senna tora]|uniref:Zinc finger BED domain-containing protein RICESLEEPER 2-like n=1 Tax=Senna tora TaxID=362788 RepID=A0A834WTD5_9FABA|nr:zinc finger BED domain-containing protein RICESLEEPER 2-like [Senna tora]